MTERRLALRALLAAAMMPALAGVPGFVMASAGKPLPEPFSSGLLWRVSRRGTPDSHVFGTIHVADPRVLWLPAAVLAAFDASRTYAMEIQLQQQDAALFLEAAQFEDGRRLAPLIGDAAYAEVSRLLTAQQVPADVIARLKPWAALANLTVTPANYQSQTLDQMLYGMARQRRMELHGLEGIDEQVAVFDSIPMDSQVALLRHALAEREYFIARLETTIQAWLQRDLAALWRISEEIGLRFPDMAAHYAQLTTRVVINRSVVMAHRLFAPLRRGRSFVAVGALHLYGRRGLLQLLREQGYVIKLAY
jgi:uncharacterized protein YbaP (TraB family)